MPQWLTQARQVFQRKAPDEAPKYEIRCACGALSQGERERLHQRLTCPVCKASLFVLPICVYPIPKAPPPPKPKKTVAGAAGQKAKANEGSTAATPVVARVPRRTPQEVLSASARWVRRHWLTPVRVALLAVAAVFIGTGYWVVHARSMRQAEVVLAASTKIGQEALRAEDLITAEHEYTLAERALDTLGRQDPQAREIRQTAHEVRAAGNLSLKALHDVLAEAVAPRPAGGTTWEESFRGSYKNAWVVLETMVARTGEDETGPHYRIDFPIALGDSRAHFVGDLLAFSGLPADEVPHRVIFAAQLDDFRPDPATANTWQIVLRPATSFLWSNVELYKLLGFVPDAQTSQVLAEQTRQLGINP